MYDSNENIKEEKGMLYPTIDELTQGKFNRYQLTIGAARGARMLTNEYVKQRVVAEKTQSIQKEAGNKEGEKPISAMVDPEYRDEKAVKLSIKRICDGEFKLVERENGEITDIDEEFNKEDDFGDDLDAASDDSEDEDLVSDEEEIEEKAEGSEE